MLYQRFRWNSAHSRLNKFAQQVPTISRCAKFCSRAREEMPHVGIYTTKWTKSRRLFALWYEQLGRCAEFLEANMEFARKKAWDLHKHMSKVKGIHVQACENSSDHRTEQLKRNLPLGQIANMKILIFVSSGASLHTVSKKNSLLAKKKKTPEDQKNPLSPRLPAVKQSRRKRRQGYVYDWNVCQNDAVRRLIHLRYCLWVYYAKKWLLWTDKNGSLHRWF